MGRGKESRGSGPDFESVKSIVEAIGGVYSVTGGGDEMTVYIKNYTGDLELLKLKIQRVNGVGRRKRAKSFGSGRYQWVFSLQ